MTTPQPIRLGTVIRYAVLPGFVPRARTLIGSGFASLAFFMALVYRAVRLLPDGHPYLNPALMGRYSIIAVMTEAWRYIRENSRVMGGRNIDQMIVFGVIVVAMILLVLQFIGLFFALTMPQATAAVFSFPGGATFANPFNMFATPAISVGGQPQNFYDLSFMFLDRVFGVPGIFNSCIADSAANSCKPVGLMYGADSSDMKVNDPGQFPWPYHIALHGMFQFYSVGLLIVAIFLLIYFTIVVVVETAQTGTPFGKRFDTVWAPLRLVVAAGLLIPTSLGLNTGQYLVLYAAKWGANFASNGWIGFNQTIMNANSRYSPLGDKTSLVATPNIPDANELLYFIAVMQACTTIENNVLQPYYGTINMDARDRQIHPVPQVKPYLVRRSGDKTDKAVFLELAQHITYDQAVKWSKNGDVVIRFGVQDKSIYSNSLGTVKPFCGELTIPTVVNPALSTDPGAVGLRYDSAAIVMRHYWNILKTLALHRNPGEGYPIVWTGGGTLPWNINNIIAEYYVDIHMYNKADYSDMGPTSTEFQALRKYLHDSLKVVLEEAVRREQQNALDPLAIPQDLLVRGWAGAAIWYNRIADMNGTLVTASKNLPKITAYPMTMMAVAKQKTQVQEQVTGAELFIPYIQTNSRTTNFMLQFDRKDQELRAAHTYGAITKWWQEQSKLTLRSPPGGNPVIDAINFLFGTSGLFSIRENANVHPLAQLSSIGKSLVERSINMMGLGLLGTAAQPWLTDEKMAGFKTALGVASGFIFSILSIGASAGFILYYVLPFLPFIYFFFAVAAWVKAIFEAMVGVPLWALAHIRIDGKGLPGDAAANGYFLILEIMIRPILIVMALIASVIIFSASVHVLNDIFNLVVLNVGGLDLEKALQDGSFNLGSIRNSVDAFFYTIMYTIIVYMLGMSCFKLIDLLPDSMLRWMGASVPAFKDPAAEQAQTLVQYGTIGSQMVFGQLSGAARNLASGGSELMKGLASTGKK